MRTVPDATDATDDPGGLEPVDSEPVEAEPLDAQPVEAEPLDAELWDDDLWDAESVGSDSGDADLSDAVTTRTSHGAGSLRLPLSPLSHHVRHGTIAAVLASAIALAVASTGGFAMTLAVALVLALVLAWAWPVLGGSWAPDMTAGVLAISAVAIVFTALREDLRWTAAAVALGIVLSFLAPLMRRTGRDGLVLTLLAAFGGLVPMASITTALWAADDPRGRAFLIVTMASTAAAVVADLLVSRRGLSPYLGLVALLAAIAGAVVASLVLDEFSPWAAVGVGAAAGSLSFSFRRVLALQPAMLSLRGQVAAGVGSVLLTGVIVRLFTLIT